MTLEQIRTLCDSAMEEYNDGYMKVYKNIPDLVEAIEKLLTVAEAAMDCFEHDEDKLHWQAIENLRQALAPMKEK